MTRTGASHDVVVVGGGPGGYVCAIRAAQLGKNVAVVEKDHLGGICLNWGCIPTKVLLNCADVLRTIRASSAYGVHARDVTHDLAAMVKRSRDAAAELGSGVAHLLRKNGITVYRGHGRLGGAGTVRVEGSSALALSAKSTVIATGARPRPAAPFAVGGPSLWTYREALTPSSIPKRLLIVGAGAIGVEFASFYHTLGSRVVIAECADRILPNEDLDVSSALKGSLESDGLDVRTSARIASASHAGGEWTVTFEGSGPERFDVVVLATGVMGNVEDLGLEASAVRVENSHVVTDELGRTSAPDVYAIGDVAAPPRLAHKASRDGIVVAEHICGLAPLPVSPDRVPACTYCHPQVASVGMTEQRARALGRDIRVGKFPFSSNGKAIATGSTTGFVKVVFDASTGELLGAHTIGENVTELIHSLAICQTLEATERELMESVFPHPTRSESIQEAVLAAYGAALHN